MNFLMNLKTSQLMNSFKLLLLLALVGCASNGRRQVASTDRAQVIFQKDNGSQAVISLSKTGCRLDQKKYRAISDTDLQKEANQCVAAGKWQNVRTISEVLAAQDTRSPWGPFFMGLVAENDNQLERALWMSEQAVQRGPQVGLLHFQKGRLLWKKEEFASSTESFIKAIQLDTNIIDAHLFLGQIYFRDQDFGKAARHFQAVLRARPQDPSALMGLSECQIQTGDAKSALETLTQGSRHFAGEAVFKVREAAVYEFLLNDIPKALELYRGIQAGFESGKYVRPLEFSITEKIRDLEMSVRGGRSVANGSAAAEVAK